MQVTFTNGEIFEWVPKMGPSVNGGSNNMGWIIIAPCDWEIAYINKGNNNESGSFVNTTEGGNPQFNISGFNKGTTTPPPPPNYNGIASFGKSVIGGEWPEDGFTFELSRFDKGEYTIVTTINVLEADLNLLGDYSFILTPDFAEPGFHFDEETRLLSVHAVIGYQFRIVELTGPEWTLTTCIDGAYFTVTGSDSGLFAKWNCDDALNEEKLFTNEFTVFGSFSFTKMVNDGSGPRKIAEDELAGISFALYKNIDDDEPFMVRLPDDNAVFKFENVPLGVYYLKEIIDTTVNTIGFVDPVVWKVTVDVGGLTEWVSLGSDTSTTYFGADFDYDEYYTIDNGYGKGYVLGYPGINNSGDIFPIGVINSKTGENYASFCANVGSKSFAECYYVVDKEHKLSVGPEYYADFVRAYNYIEDNYGTLEDYRVVTQIVTWVLLGGIDVESGKFEDINWVAVEAGTDYVKGVPGAKAIIEDVIDNYKDYDGSGKIVDVVFLVAGDGTAYVDAQPQLVPIYGMIYTNFIAPNQ
jgi:hypothetical protein